MAAGDPGQIYGKGNTSPTSSVGTQFNEFLYSKKALIELAKEAYFGQLSGVMNMPKHFGKTIKKYLYLPILDERNINSQGIDANGNVTANGNLYASSKDVGTITGKLPLLSENGGRVNRVGMTRKTVEGSMAKYGMHEDYTQESMDFDTDEKLEMHLTRELLRAAHEVNEDQLQIDLLTSPGVVRYTGVATQDSEISGETGAVTIVTYDDLVKLRVELDNNRTPKQTKIITGSRMIDTKTVPASRYMFIGSEMITTLERMVDYHGRPAFVPIEQYGNAGTIARGEIGTVAGFRIIVVPEMMHWAGAGASVTNNDGYSETGGKYDIFPMLVVGDGSFTNIGFQTDGKSVKFKTKHVKPEENYSSLDPYGEKGFMSIKWWYGFLLERSERIAVIKTVAEG